MELITLTNDNIHTEHICCAIGDKKSESGVRSKKEWLKSRMQDGLKFVKANVRGKVFIEYLPAENSWMPVYAPGYLLINCLWVSGSFKGKGYGSQLLKACEEDAEGGNGVVVVVGKKKKPFLGDKAFFIKQGYEVCDSADPYFELLVKRFVKDGPLPRFNEKAKTGMPQDTIGIDIFYTPQCPFTTVYIELLKPVISGSGIPVRTHEICNLKEAQSHYCPVTTYSVFVDGKYYTNEVLNPVKLQKIIDGMH